MKLLIVDDEIYIVRAMLNSIDWKQIGINQTFMAFNVEKAREIMQEQHIDIVITDIEMPRESGLDFLEWIRKQKIDCKLICMTCHNEFKYAHRALRSHVSDYILKPVNFQKFSEVIKRIVQELAQERANRQMHQKGILWNQNRQKVENVFWKDVLSGNIEAKPEVLELAARKVNICWDHNQQYQLFLFAFRRINKEKEQDDKLLQKTVLQLFEDLFPEGTASIRLGWKDPLHLWCIISAEKSGDFEAEEFIAVCEKCALVQTVVYTDEICYGEELHACYLRLCSYDAENVFLEKGIFSFVYQNRMENTDRLIYQKLRKRLRDRQFHEACLLAEELWSQGNYISSGRLFLNIHAGQYEIYRWLEENQMNPEQFWNDEVTELRMLADHSVKSYKEWMTAAVNRLEVLCNMPRTEKRVILQIEKYVQDHIEERISRDEIAKDAGFTSDYISRLFRKETGISLSEFIMKKKIERSRELIESDADSISNIAMSLGYNSFSYFSEIFKRQTGYLPSEYKRIKRQNHDIGSEYL